MSVLCRRPHCRPCRRACGRPRPWCDAAATSCEPARVARRPACVAQRGAATRQPAAPPCTRSRPAGSRPGRGAASRQARARRGGRWPRATHGRTRPAPADGRQKNGATGGGPAPCPSPRGAAAGVLPSGGGAWRRPPGLPGCWTRRPGAGETQRGPKPLPRRQGVARRPVRAAPRAWLPWGRARGAAPGRTAGRLSGDTASGHLRTAVRLGRRPPQHTVQQTGHGGRLRAWRRPRKSPWLPPMEPPWVPGQRALGAPDRWRRAPAGMARVHAYDGGTDAAHRAMSEKAA
jgi:hypothetical protein